MELLRLLHCDTELKDKGSATEHLLLIGAELIIRFSMYREYPFRLALCWQAYNQTGYLHSITHFLACNRDSVDVGYSFQLQAAALGQGSLEKALAWMTSRAVQQELMTWTSSVEGSTLDVERARSQARRGETRKMVRVSTASRDMILRWYRAHGKRGRGKL